MSHQPPSIHIRWPLWLQLALALFTVLVLVNLITASLARNVVSNFVFKQVEEQSRGSFALLAATAIDAVITEDIPLLETIAAQSLAQAPNMVGLTIENEKGDLLVQSLRPHSEANNDIRNYSYTIKFEGERFGTINIHWDIEPVQQEINRHVAEVQIFISAMLILLTGLTVILIHWLTVRPIRRITSHLTALSENKQLPLLKKTLYASRELELLATSANDLAGMMQQRDQRERELLQTREQLQVAHDEALSANRAKSGFLATMSHEIRTPMNAVLGILGLLRDTSLDNNQLELVRTGRDSGELLLTIINDILDFSKMEADKLELEHTSFDLHRLLANSTELLKPQADQKSLALILFLNPNLPRYTKGDPDRLRQILINLINNAIKFTPSGKVTIKASASTVNNENFILHCSVQDTGIGIAKHLQTSLFEEFTMVDQSHSRNHQGTGLGLAICKRLATLMHGKIDFSSKPGIGSTFVFTPLLEMANESECENEQESQEYQQLPAANTRILLAEDNPANQLVIKSILEYAGLQVDIVANGREAVDAVRSIPYDIVLMDISMPEMDGMIATRKIRQLSGQASKLPIVALTAHALSGDKKHFIEAGMNDYLSKPIDRNAMLYCISRWTKSSNPQMPQSDPVTPQADTSSADTNDKPDDLPDEPFVDEAVLKQLARDTSPEIVPELLLFYIEDARKRVEKIQNAITEHDAKTLEFESHTLGSSAAAHGNAKLHTLARRVEHLCQQSNHELAFADADLLSLIADDSFRLLTQRAEKGF